MLQFLHYEHGKTEVAREQAQQISLDEGAHSFEIENVVDEMLETNIITVNTEQSSETDSGLTNDETIVTTVEAKHNLITKNKITNATILCTIMLHNWDSRASKAIILRRALKQ